MSPQHNGQPNNDKADANNKEVASHVDPDFQLDETPSWAEMPELERHLRQQCNMDGHKIFGRMTPLVTSGKTSPLAMHNRRYTNPLYRGFWQS